jgi:hypothetical protein
MQKPASRLHIDRTQTIVLLILIALAAGYFALMIPPNSSNSANFQMVAAFSADESVPLPYALHMIRPSNTPKEALLNFARYGYYFYGFPHFALSALVLLPVQMMGQLGNTQVVMTTLRQCVSVLPMLLAVLLLVYMQTRFKSYFKSIFLFVLLLSIPAVVQNNFWWHPDSLAFLLMALTIFFLDRDGLRLGWNFYISALLCGYAAGTKGVGFYFFLSVFAYLLLALLQKKASWKKALLSSFGYILAMAAGYLLAEPMLVYASIRRMYFSTMASQSFLLNNGYELHYAKGLAAAWPQLTSYYGGWWFLLAAFAACLWGALRGPRKLLYTILLTWAIPLSVMVFGLIHFKYQYWLPVALPLVSCLEVALPGDGFWKQWLKPGKKRLGAALQAALTILVTVQLVLFGVRDARDIQAQIHRSETSPSIQFYNQVQTALAPLPSHPYHTYIDISVYVAPEAGWVMESSFEMLNYDYIQGKSFDILLLEQQRLYDYLNPNAQGIDPAKLAAARVFYNDANQGKISGYHLLYRDKYGLVYINDRLYQQYFKPK